MTNYESNREHDDSREHTLDVDHEELERLVGEARSLVLNYFSLIRTLPVFPETTATEIAQKFGSELPEDPVALEVIIKDCQRIFANSRHNGHPRFFGYVASPANAPGVVADFLASALNSNLTSWRSSPAGTQIEKTVVEWLGKMTGFSQSAGGLLTSGGSMANMNALLMANRTRCRHDAARKGVGDNRMTVYASREVHQSIVKAADLIGLGREAVRLVPVDGRWRINLKGVEETIRADIQKGFQPFCLVGNAGTVATGAVDPLNKLADIASTYGMWLHVDGAYGAPAFLDAEKSGLFEGINRADSLSVDAHKWLYTPVDCGCLLVRDPSAPPRTFSESSDASYIRVFEEADEAFAFWDQGIELSRRFRALKIWMMLNYFGVKKIAASISEDNRTAAYMGRSVEESEEFELLAPVELSICCFRYAPRARATAEGVHREALLNRLNEEILHSVQRSGEAYLSNAMLNGKFALRACIVNFRTTRADIDLTLEIIRRTGEEILAKGKSSKELENEEQ